MEKITKGFISNFSALFICALIILVIWVLEMFLITKLVSKGRAYVSEWIHEKLLNKLWRSPKERQSNEEIEDLKAEPGAELLNLGKREAGPLDQGERVVQSLDEGERVEPLDQGGRGSKIVTVASNEQVEVLDSEVFIIYPYNHLQYKYMLTVTIYHCILRNIIIYKRRCPD